MNLTLCRKAVGGNLVRKEKIIVPYINLCVDGWMDGSINEWIYIYNVSIDI